MRSRPQVRLVGAYGVRGTELDGRDDVYAATVDAWLAALPADTAALPAEPAALPEGFLLYRSADWAGVGRGACAPAGGAE